MDCFVEFLSFMGNKKNDKMHKNIHIRKRK
ncbi:hypothetical protein CGSHi22121_07100 [Haemophilus influenzae 22.1-21]|nr:hypothetical protein CGSHi22121_07100 [Haemophilus influenzae 22.1-21]